MAEKSRYQNRIELLQGTLDMLIPKRFSGANSMAMGSARRFGRIPEMSCRWKQARCIRRCTGWSVRSG